MTMTHLPALFVPHGAPSVALRPGAAGAALAALAPRLPPVRALLMVSAHWSTQVPTLGWAPEPATIHDFWGFPEELYAIRYPAKGDSQVAAQVEAAIQAAGLPVARDPNRGLDHGAWIPARLLFPDAQIPVLPLSLQSRQGPEQAYRLGQALAPLAKQGILVVGSGNLTHNLRDYQTFARQGGGTPAYVREFSDWCADRLAAEDVPALLDYRRQAPGGAQAHPTEEHLLPLFLALGAGGPQPKVEVIHRGVADQVICMDAYAFAQQ